MPCCGQTRHPFTKPTDPPRSPTHATGYRRAATQGIPFVYVGPTGVTAIGPVTGRRYRFARPGAQLHVDPRDAPALAAVPGVRRSKT